MLCIACEYYVVQETCHNDTLAAEEIVTNITASAMSRTAHYYTEYCLNRQDKTVPDMLIDNFKVYYIANSDSTISIDCDPDMDLSPL